MYYKLLSLKDKTHLLNVFPKYGMVTKKNSFFKVDLQL